MSQINADLVIDCRGLLCPMPIVRLARGIKQVRPGTRILVYTDDPAAKSDMEAWSQRTGNRIVGFWQNGKTMTFLVEKKIN